MIVTTECGRILEDRIQGIRYWDGDPVLQLCGEDFYFHNQAILHTARANDSLRATGEAFKSDLCVGQLVRIYTSILKDHADRKYEFIKHLAILKEELSV